MVVWRNLIKTIMKQFLTAIPLGAFYNMVKLLDVLEVIKMPGCGYNICPFTA
tara:strand:- start:125 stop:280 length:156 start_codon:yes stop_codon:yes gene_type:complete